MNSQDIFTPPPPEPDAILPDWKDVLTGFMLVGLSFFVFCLCLCNVLLVIHCIAHNGDMSAVKEKIVDTAEEMASK
jgi:hypothetical protein